MAKLLTAATANGAGPALSWKGFGKERPDTAYCWGTFDGATATLQATPDGTTWFDLVDQNGDVVAFAADGVVAVDMTAIGFRGVIADAGAGTSISMVIL